MEQNRVSLPSERPAAQRYFQFTLLVVAAGAIYPLLYLRQNFETSLLSGLNIDIAELCQCYFLLGVTFFLSYLPGGWITDRFSPRNLIVFSLATVGLLGLWFSTFPEGLTLKLIFVGWGLSTGLTFWAPLLKGVNMLATPKEQSRFFGLLDGGRWLVEAMLASIALAIFMSHMGYGGGARQALQQIIYMYCFACFCVAVLVLIFLKNGKTHAAQTAIPSRSLFSDLKVVCGSRQIWLLVLIIFGGYQLYWSTYSFSAYLQQVYGLTAVTAGFVTMSSLWVTAIGAVVGGFLGDYFSKETLLGCCQFLASVGIVCLMTFPKMDNPSLLASIVLLNSVFIGAIRGIYWSLLSSCYLPREITGLAIGLISMIAYLPDILLPLLNAQISRHYPPTLGYQMYFAYIVVCGFMGAGATFYFKKYAHRRGRQ